jgi:putative tryptophan/tyrosine transport system substrate-binding protein
VKRRTFIAGISGAAAWPVVARAQTAVPAIGFLSSRSPGEAATAVAAFRQGLGQSGFFEGKNVTIEYRWAEGDYTRLPALAVEVATHNLAAIAATGGEPSALAAKNATRTIPIVFAIGGDPITVGLVASLSRPEGNVTGVSFFFKLQGAKRLEMLHQLLPSATSFAILVNPNNPTADDGVKTVEDAARSLGLELVVLKAITEREIDLAFAALSQTHAEALIVSDDPFFLGQRDQIVALAVRDVVPIAGFTREFAASGALISYGTSLVNGYRQVGIYIGEILKGAQPSSLPVLQPTKFELVINLKTAAALKLKMPAALLAFADEVIE